MLSYVLASRMGNRPHQNNRNNARRIVAHTPRMYRAALYKHIAGFEQSFTGIQNGIDFAFEHDNIINGIGLVAHRVI